jgi:hypothetical protein
MTNNWLSRGLVTLRLLFSFPRARRAHLGCRFRALKKVLSVIRSVVATASEGSLLRFTEAAIV